MFFPLQVPSEKTGEQAGQRPIALGVHAGFASLDGSLISLCVDYTDTPLDLTADPQRALRTIPMPAFW